MKQYEYTLETRLVSPCIQLVYKNNVIIRYSGIKQILSERFNGNDVELYWDPYSEDLLSLSIEIYNPYNNYGEKLDSAIQKLADICDDYNYIVRICGETVKVSV